MQNKILDIQFVSDFNPNHDTLTLKYYYVDGYYNISKYNSYDFTFPHQGFHFSFLYKVDNSKLNKILFFEYEEKQTVKTYLYDNNKTTLNTANKIFGGFSFSKYGVNEFFIRVDLSKGSSSKVNLRLEDKPNLYELSFENNTLILKKLYILIIIFILIFKKHQKIK